MRTVYTITVREDLSYHGLKVPYYTRNSEWKVETLGYLGDDELNGAVVLVTSDETGDVYVELKDGRKLTVNARDIDWYKDGEKQEVIK
jgi:hypothetical protein